MQQTNARFNHVWAFRQPKDCVCGGGGGRGGYNLLTWLSDGDETW